MFRFIWLGLPCAELSFVVYWHNYFVLYLVPLFVHQSEYKHQFMHNYLGEYNSYIATMQIYNIMPSNDGTLIK